MFQASLRPSRNFSRAPGRSGNWKRNTISSLMPAARPPTICRTWSLATSLSVRSVTERSLASSMAMMSCFSASPPESLMPTKIWALAPGA
ncbi:hypothetical protein D3C86_1991950 [compost metagenome]